MDGYYHLGSSKMQMQGVVSPFYLVNSVGRVVARKGEGLIGFNYSLSGTPEDPDVDVNLLSLLHRGSLETFSGANRRRKARPGTDFDKSTR